MIRPLHNRILIRRHDPEADSFGGIHIPEEHRDRPLKATVVAVATRTSHSGATLPPMVAVGDVVLVGKFAGIEVRDPETHELLAMVDESEVVGVFEPVFYDAGAHGGDRSVLSAVPGYALSEDDGA